MASVLVEADCEPSGALLRLGVFDAEGPPPEELPHIGDDSDSLTDVSSNWSGSSEGDSGEPLFDSSERVRDSVAGMLNSARISSLLSVACDGVAAVDNEGVGGCGRRLVTPEPGLGADFSCCLSVRVTPCSFFGSTLPDEVAESGRLTDCRAASTSFEPDLGFKVAGAAFVGWELPTGFKFAGLGKIGEAIGRGF